MFDMFSLFGLLSLGSDMVGTYEERKVARYDDEATGLSVSTARVTGGGKPFETAVKHPFYNDHRWVVVEAYDSKELAQAGHERWVATMTAETLPTKLVDCANAAIAQLGVELLGKDWLEKPRI